MSKKESKNGLRKPFPGDDRIPACLRGCTTASDILAKFENLNTRAFDEAAQLKIAKVGITIANQGVKQAKETLAKQLQRLVPVLREMQLILSHKSTLHHLFADLDLPSFSDWAKEFVAKAEIEASWSTIKLAMGPNRKSPALRSKGHIPALKLQAQRVGYAALAGTELADALNRDQDPEDALGRLRAAGASKEDILDLLKRAGVKDVIRITTAGSTATNYSYSRSDSQFRETPADGTDIRPGGYSQVESLLDLAVGPASRRALNVEDPALQLAGFERLISYWARKWVPFNANLGTLELTVRFVPKAKPELRREPSEAPTLEGRALVASDRLLSSSQGSADVNL